jgi:hypothetical protein
MSEKPTKDQGPGGASPHAGADPDQSVYGGQWGPGAAPTSHNQPGSTPSSPPETDASLSPQYDEAAQRERREQRWDSEGGAASNRPDGA